MKFYLFHLAFFLINIFFVPVIKAQDSYILRGNAANAANTPPPPPSIKPKSVEDLKCIIENTTRFHHVKELMPIGSDLIAYKIKEQLDLRHTEDIEIKEISELFKLTLSQTTKIFAKTFGLTPVEYRSKVRIFNSMFNLLISKDNTDVTEIAYESGFSDLSRFNKQFKKITSTTPSKFKFR